jgi:hypothetical protein
MYNIFYEQFSESVVAVRTPITRDPTNYTEK